jgi:hypothetical protein
MVDRGNAIPDWTRIAATTCAGIQAVEELLIAERKNVVGRRTGVNTFTQIVFGSFFKMGDLLLWAIPRKDAPLWSGVVLPPQKVVNLCFARWATSNGFAKKSA